MKQIHKKSADPAVNSLLVQAKRSGVELSWDRAETQQPQCGFGRLNLCCTDCGDGPCRISPFEADGGQTICGRERSELENSRLLHRVSDGTAALLSLAAANGAKTEPAALVTEDDLLAASDWRGKLQELGTCSARVLQSLTKAAAPDSSVLPGNLGALKADVPNILVYGHVSPTLLTHLCEIAAQASPPVNLLGACGGEGTGALPLVTNYVSQEVPFLTGAVDALIVGPQSVMPAAVALALARGAVVVKEKELDSPAAVGQLLEQAVAVFGRRLGKAVAIPAERAEYSCLPAKNPTGWAWELVHQTKAAGKKGFAFVGGCGRVGVTQDREFVGEAVRLSQAGWQVVTAGCAGAALIKAGLCHQGEAVYLGSCLAAGYFLELAGAAAGAGVDTCAVFREASHSKMLATAAAFTACGIDTRIEMDEGSEPAESAWTGRLKAGEN